MCACVRDLFYFLLICTFYPCFHWLYFVCWQWSVLIKSETKHVHVHVLRAPLYGLTKHKSTFSVPVIIQNPFNKVKPNCFTWCTICTQYQRTLKQTTLLFSHILTDRLLIELKSQILSFREVVRSTKDKKCQQQNHPMKWLMHWPPAFLFFSYLPNSYHKRRLPPTV